METRLLKAAALGQAGQKERKLQEQLAEANKALGEQSYMKKEIDDCKIQGVFMRHKKTPW